jgi:CRP-like cAMP-binding protein
MVMSGGLQVVKVAERTEPCTGLYWDVLAELGPGDWFGEGSLLTGAPRSATVVASAPCELVEHLADLMASRAAHAAEAPRAAHRREAWMAEIRHWFRI